MSGVDEKFLKIIEKLGDVSEKIGRVEAQCENMREDIKEIKAEDARQNEQLTHQNTLLAEHIQGVKTNTARLEEEKKLREEKNKEHDDRINKLEESPKFRKQLRNKIVYIAGTLAAIGTILKFFGIW